MLLRQLLLQELLFLLKSFQELTLSNQKEEQKIPKLLLDISDLGGISSAGGLGAMDGFIQALVTAYPMYKPESNNPGKIAAANKS